MKKLIIIIAVIMLAQVYGDEQSMYGNEAGNVDSGRYYREEMQRQQRERYQEEQLELQRQQLKELQKQNNGFGNRYNYNPYAW